jgi:hypothetical protein
VFEGGGGGRERRSERERERERQCVTEGGEGEAVRRILVCRQFGRVCGLLGIVIGILKWRALRERERESLRESEREF